MSYLTRRSMMKAAAGVVGATAWGAASIRAAENASPSINFSNDDFYAADGKFDVERGKDAVLALCKYHGYPVFDGFREGLWVSDYNTGQFTQLGLAAFMFKNNAQGLHSYMLMDLFLLPNQMLPEHWHLPAEGNAAKNEGWLVRWGASHIVGIGEPNLDASIVIPSCHCNGTVTVEHATLAKPGTFVPLAEVGSRHWQYGGPQGAIITEVANVHTDSAVRHSDKALNDYFLGGG